ncbi:MAG: DNA polymerase I [Elusimicrobia bacterium]|nr:DNA polymerase I [Elusimicrobiota bacterium]
MSPSQTEKIYLIDAHGFLHRAYHALPKLSTSSGQEVGALFGFARMLLRVLEEKKPSYMAVCFDSPGKTRRHGEYPLYKAHRKPVEDALVSQLALAPELASGLGLRTVARSGAEADDLIASLCVMARACGAEVVVVSTDKDLHQLLSDSHVAIWPGGKDPLRRAEYVKEKFGVEPSQLGDYLAIVGDSSDNIPGVAGVGAKTAAQLLNAFGSLEKIMSAAESGAEGMKPSVAAKLKAGKDSALLSRKLVELEKDIDLGFSIEQCRPGDPAANAAELFRRFEFRDLLRLNAAARPAQDAPKSAVGQWAEVLAQAVSSGEVFLDADGGLLAVGLKDGPCAFAAAASLPQADRSALERLLFASSSLKIGHDLKNFMRVSSIRFPKNGNIRSFDTMLACYCLNPARASYDFEAMALEYGSGTPAYSSPEEKLAGRHAQAWGLKAVLEEQLRGKSLFPLYNEMELPLMPVLAGMESAGIAVDTAALRALGNELEAELSSLQADIDQAAGWPVNANSPKQIGELLFEKLQLPHARKTKTGYSTDEETLSAIEAAHPVVAKILAYREAAKLKATYVDGLLQLVNPDTGRVHTNFNQNGTATGRLSSSRPNVQNIPIRTEQGRRVRRAFMARKGWALVSADYSQIDLRVLAHESGDEALCAAFNSGQDVHTRTAAEVFGVMEVGVTREMRRAAKAINFSIVYGQTGMRLAQNLGISRQAAQKYIDHYFQTYSGVKAWIENTVAQAKKEASVRTLSGRIRYLPEITSSNGAIAAGAQRAAVNTVIQGGSADIIKKAMLAADRLLSAEQAEMVMQVHDELVFEVPEKDLRRLLPLLRGAMEGAQKLRVPLIADLKTGPNWQEMAAVPRESGVNS